MMVNDDETSLGEPVEAVAHKLIQVFEDVSPRLTSSDDFIGRQLGADAWARCIALLEAILVVRPQRPDVCGCLVRNLLEALAVGAVLVLDIEDQIVRLQNSFRDKTHVYQSVNGLEPQLARSSEGAPPGV